MPDGYQTLATVLREGDYDTGLFGKWHLGSSPRFGPNHYGFNTSYGSLAGGVDPYNHRYKRGEFSVTWQRNGELIEEKGHVTDLIAREAVKWIETRERPWFCYVPFTAVHVPVKAPQDWLDKYAFESYDDDVLKDRSFKRYAAYASQMDYAVGQLVESLERTGQRDNTLIIFSSDNGAIDQCPLHGTDKYPGWQEESPRLGSNLPLRGLKAELYEGGIRTPTLINWRGVLHPGKMDHTVQVVDWMPTLTKLVNLKPEEDPKWDGVDIWPRISGEEKEPVDRDIYWNFKGGSQLAARQGDWKLISNEKREGGKLELFNISEDPLEERESSSDHLEIVEDLLDFIGEQRRLDDVSKRDDVDSPLVS